jgi:hypothetical protein
MLDNEFAGLARELERFSTPASHAASGWSCWSGRRPSPSRCAMSQVGGVGRSAPANIVELRP